MGLIDDINRLDNFLILEINSYHSNFLDQIMYALSHKWYPIPLYAFLLYLLYQKYGLKKLLFVLVPAITLMIVIADYTASGIFKPTIERLRPCHTDLNLYLADGCGGKFGFFSSHASNTFATAIFLILHVKEKFKAIYLLILWAALVALSRVYLGAHYVTDVTAGALFGSLVGTLCYRVSKLFLSKEFST